MSRDLSRHEMVGDTVSPLACQRLSPSRWPSLLSWTTGMPLSPHAPALRRAATVVCGESGPLCKSLALCNPFANRFFSLFGAILCKWFCKCENLSVSCSLRNTPMVFLCSHCVIRMSVARWLPCDRDSGVAGQRSGQASGEDLQNCWRVCVGRPAHFH